MRLFWDTVYIRMCCHWLKCHAKALDSPLQRRGEFCSLFWKKRTFKLPISRKRGFRSSDGLRLYVAAGNSCSSVYFATVSIESFLHNSVPYGTDCPSKVPLLELEGCRHIKLEVLGYCRRCLYDHTVSHLVQYRLVTDRQTNMRTQDYSIYRASKRRTNNSALSSLFLNLLIFPQMHHSCSKYKNTKNLFCLENKKNVKSIQTAEKSIILHCVDLDLNRLIYQNVLHRVKLLVMSIIILRVIVAMK